jgi:hypothetical protein
MSSKFGALGKLNSARAETEDIRKLEILNSPETETQKAGETEFSESWEALGTEVKTATKRRLKAYAGANGRKLKELVDEALNAYLDGLG